MSSRIVIVGAGVNGLSTAYYLAKMDKRDIIIFEKSYVGSGSSTRNAGHFRVHFWAPENVKFAIEARRRLLRFWRIFGWNPTIRTGGYLFLVYDEKLLKHYERANKMWEKFGVPGIIMDPSEVKKRYPYINVEDMIGAFFGPQDGEFHHDSIVYGYLYAAEKLGVKIYENSVVENIVVKNNEVKGVKVNGKIFECDKVLITAGEGSIKLFKDVGIELPLRPVRKEVGVTEPISITIRPLIVNTRRNMYISQTIRGELIGSIEYPEIEGIIELENTLTWMSHFVRTAVETIPMLRHARLMRAWAGYYIMSPDNSQIMGRSPEWPAGLYLMTGFSGHGFMMSHLAGELMAKYIITGETHDLMKPFLPTRFRENKLIKETIVIG